MIRGVYFFRNVFSLYFEHTYINHRLAPLRVALVVPFATSTDCVSFALPTAFFVTPPLGFGVDFG